MTTRTRHDPAAAQTATRPDFGAIKQKQRATWSAGDFAVIGTTITIVGETLCEAVDLRPGQRVLDVATGSGSTAIAAARRFAEVERRRVGHVRRIVRPAGRRDARRYRKPCRHFLRFRSACDQTRCPIDLERKCRLDE